ncbi:MAG: hypothetical protein GX455_16745 [Phycisphaerae bacterium]|nr:hypothetical protein [Phycisphaerae bacterium]
MKNRVLITTGLFITAVAVGAVSFQPDQPTTVSFTAVEARFVRLAICASSQGQPCIDELEIYGPQSDENLALAKSGAVASASSCLPGYAIHQIVHLNDGLYGNSHSWIAENSGGEWAQIQLPKPAVIHRVVFSRDREGKFHDRMPDVVEVQLSLDGNQWKTMARASSFPSLSEPFTQEGLFQYAFECEDLSWQRIDKGNSLTRILRQMEEMIGRMSAAGVEVSGAAAELAEFRQRQAAMQKEPPYSLKRAELLYQAHLAKRQLFLRDLQLAEVHKILFVKRQPFEPSHNYSDLFDSAGDVGGGVCVLEIPRIDGSLVPEKASVTTLFDSGDGIARDPMASFDARTVYFSYRTSKSDYYHLHSVGVKGGAARQLTNGPFHDFYPCPLPDGGLAFISTRCKARFLCWRPQSFVLFRMDSDGEQIQPLSLANLSEWTPSVMNDGRILWMRSEYLDKGADFGHTLWAIRPDGTHPELIFGNNTLNCYANGRQVPGTAEILCTLVSHGGDLNGPIALIEPERGRSNPAAISNITPDVAPQYHMTWLNRQCFRDPFPVSRDYYLCSHAGFDRFGIYLIDRYGNRELLYLDPQIGSMAPTLLRPVPTPPVMATAAESGESAPSQAEFFVADIYRGLGPAVKRGSVRYIRICEEVRAGLIQLANGEFQADHEPFEDWYATPTHKVRGPYGWPSFVAKGDLGIVPVEEDGSANFTAPAGKVLYFEALDADLNEIQRMRSVVQLQPGERRGCIGCHENRLTATPSIRPMPKAVRRQPSAPIPPPWGVGPFAYEKVVQPVWDAKCIQCHNAQDQQQINLTGVLDADGVPASFRTLIEKGYVHYFDFAWGREHNKAEPLTFGTVQSKLWKILNAGHYDTRLTDEESHRVKCWIDLNCPLWPDYLFRPSRIGVQAANRPAR